MPRVVEKTTKTKEPDAEKPAISELGRKLRLIRDQIVASGEKMYTRRELEREMRERRGGTR